MKLSLPYTPREIDSNYYDYYESMNLDATKYNEQDDFKNQIKYEFIKYPRFYGFIPNYTEGYGENFNFNSSLGTYYGAGYLTISYSSDLGYITGYRWPQYLWRTKTIPIPINISFTLSRKNTNRFYLFKLDIYGNISKRTTTIASAVVHKNSNPGSFTDKVFTFNDIQNKYLDSSDTHCILYWYCPCYAYSNKYGGAFQDPLYIKKFTINFK